MLRPRIPARRRDFARALAVGFVALLLGCFLLQSDCTGAFEPPAGRSESPAIPTAGQAQQMEQVLWRHVLDAWYPRCLDRTGGGFHENFAEDWSPLPDDSKFVVFQARMTWTAATVAKHYPQHRERFLSYTRHGLAFLRDHFIDWQHGGCFEVVDESGEPLPGRRNKATRWKAAYHVVRGLLVSIEAKPE